MMETKTLQVLRECDPTASDVDPSAVILPEPWRTVLSARREAWKDRALELWAAKTGAFLPRFVAAQRHELQDVSLVRFNGLIQVAYKYPNRVFVGGLPRNKGEEFGMLAQGPPALRLFYREVHDGYVFPFSGSLGPLALHYLFTLDDDEWGWLEESDDPREYDPLEEKVVILTNGGGGYLCMDASAPQGDDAPGLIWWRDEPPDIGGLLAVLDAWMEIGLTV
jgi:hypothetical protein